VSDRLFSFVLRAQEEEIARKKKAFLAEVDAENVRSLLLFLSKLELTSFFPSVLLISRPTLSTSKLKRTSWNTSRFVVFSSLPLLFLKRSLILSPFLIFSKQKWQQTNLHRDNWLFPSSNGRGWADAAEFRAKDARGEISNERIPRPRNAVEAEDLDFAWIASMEGNWGDAAKVQAYLNDPKYFPRGPGVNW